MMRKCILTLFLSFVTTQWASAQTIIPFPTLRESHEAIRNKNDVQKRTNYAIYDSDYQQQIKALDERIEALNDELRNTTDLSEKNALERTRMELIKRKAALRDEVELMDDLQKFY